MFGLIFVAGCAIPVSSPQAPAAARLPPPPSIAINPATIPASVPVIFSVDIIPAEAKYVIYAQLKLGGHTIDQSNAREAGTVLSGLFAKLAVSARERGANLIVLLSPEHGIAVPIEQCDRALILRAVDPTATAVFFRWNPATGISERERQIRFSTSPPPKTGKSIHDSISLEINTAGVTKSYWTYANIARFVQEATAHGFDTIAMRSTNDSEFEEVWLPGCDEPLKVSTKKPELDVTLYKRK